MHCLKSVLNLLGKCISEFFFKHSLTNKRAVDKVNTEE